MKITTLLTILISIACTSCGIFQKTPTFRPLAPAIRSSIDNARAGGADTFEMTFTIAHAYSAEAGIPIPYVPLTVGAGSTNTTQVKVSVANLNKSNQTLEKSLESLGADHPAIADGIYTINPTTNIATKVE